jgi:hypothetical protein
MDRIFTACHGTQLLVIQHLRCHLPSSAARDFLLWHPMDNIPRIDTFMKSVISTAGFADVLDMRNFESLKPRSHDPFVWWFESVRRLRRDASAVRGWMERNGIREENAELWTDDPAQLYVDLPRGILRKSRHVKIPHSFNHEDVASSPIKRLLEAGQPAVSWPKKYVFAPWQRLASGVDLRMEGVLYDRAYSFDLPSCWAEKSVDVSDLIAVDKFEATYRTLPLQLRAEVEANLATLRGGKRPLVLLLLFGFGDGTELRSIYEESMTRIFCERAAELKDCTLAVKLHPGASGVQELRFIEWLRTHIAASILPIDHSLNLEFMLSQVQPDFVLAGLCGSLPIVRQLKIGTPVGLSELIDAFVQDHPTYPVAEFLKGVEIW